MRHQANAFTTSIAIMAIFWAQAGLPAQPAPVSRPATAPGAGPAGAGGGAVELTGRITSVRGIVQIRTSETEKWQPAKVDMKLSQGAEFRTGLRSAVQFVIEPDQLITLDHLGTIKVLQAFVDRNKVTTDLGMKYGRARYDIQNADLEHQSTIRSPGSTLAIRGTDVTFEDQVPWVPNSVSRHGRADFRDFNGKQIAFGGTKKTVVAADKNGPAGQAISTTKIDPRTGFAGRSQNEENLLLTLQSLGGIDAQAQQALQNLFKSQGFAGTGIGVPDVPGPLDITLIWLPKTGTTSPNPIFIDMQVTDPHGKTASMTNPTIETGTSQGVYSSSGGQNGNGQDLVAFGAFFPAGKYKIKATERAGGDPAQVLVNVTQGNPPNLQTLKMLGYDSDPKKEIFLTPGQTFTTTFTTRAVGKGR